MPNKLTIYTLAAFLLLSACNSNKDEKANNETTQKTDEPKTSNPSTDKSKRATIDVTITGGEMNGSYSAVCTDACCSWGIAGENVFGNQYSESGKGPKELSSVQLLVEDVKQGNKSTSEFTVTVSFGELFGTNSKSFNINTSKGKSEGSGKLDLQYEGDRAVVTIKGTSKEGPAIDLKMECHKVLTAANLTE